jgi:hypothetical protein
MEKTGYTFQLHRKNSIENWLLFCQAVNCTIFIIFHFFLYAIYSGDITGYNTSCSVIMLELPLRQPKASFILQDVNKTIFGFTGFSQLKTHSLRVSI